MGLKLRHDTAANWTSADPTLEMAERGYETDTQTWKTGDGITAWTSLPYDAVGATLPIAESDVTNLTTDLAAKVPTTRQVIAGTGLTGGGALSADRTLAVSYGTTSGTAAQGNDSRLSDARTPTAHAASHASAGSDPVTIAESQVTNLTTDLAAKLAAASNLSDVTNTGTARWNLKVPVQSRAIVVATTNQTLSGLPTIDGVTLIDSNRVLLPAQTTASQNGPWLVHSGAWTRPDDFPTGGITQATSVLVAGGTVYAGSVWVMTNTGSVTIDSGSQTWAIANTTATQALTNKDLTSGTNTFPSFPESQVTNLTTDLAAKAPLVSPTFTGIVTLPIGLTGLAKVTSGLVTAVTAPSGAVVGTTDTQTLTNKRRTPRVFSTASTATLTPEIDTYDAFTITAQAAALNIANHSTSTPTDFEQMRIRILDNGTARAITYGTNYVARGGTALPSTTVLSKYLELGFEWNATTSKWNLLAVAQET